MTVNLTFAWVWILLGIVSGMLLGMQFHRVEWLGGYCALKRRMLRLGHIALFGMAFINLLFYLTVRTLAIGGSTVSIAGWGFVVGGVMMPLCCALMALKAELRMLFALPVTCLTVSSILTIMEVSRL